MHAKRLYTHLISTVVQFDGLWKCLNNPACSKVSVFKGVKLDSMEEPYDTTIKIASQTGNLKAIVCWWLSHLKLTVYFGMLAAVTPEVDYTWACW